MGSSRLAASLVLFACGVPLARGQSYPLWQVDGSGALDHLGTSVAIVGDLDGDGIADVLVGIPLANPAALLDAGRVTLLSGASSAVLATIDGSSPFANFGAAVGSAGDVSGDGIPDLLVGAPHHLSNVPGAGEVRVFSGATGTLLLAIPGSFGDALGAAVVGIGDVNGDAVPDVLVGAPFAAGAVGLARVFSGAGGLPLATFTGAVSGEFFGFSVAAAGDVDGDSVTDLLVGSAEIVCVGPPPVACDAGPGTAKVFSGATGTTLFTFTGASNDGQLGCSVAGPGDVSGDGVPDFLVGARHPLAGSGEARVFSGSSGALLHVLAGSSPLDGFGEAVAGAGDLDADGLADLLVGAPGADPDGPGPLGKVGEVLLYSGASGTRLASFPGATLYDRFGEAIAGGADLDGDGLPDILAATPLANPGGIADAGRLQAFSFVGLPAGSTVLGSGCAGSGGFVPAIGTSGGSATSSGNPAFALHLSHALGGAPAYLIAGTSSSNWAGGEPSPEPLVRRAPPLQPPSLARSDSPPRNLYRGPRQRLGLRAGARAAGSLPRRGHRLLPVVRPGSRERLSGPGRDVPGNRDRRVLRNRLG
jgi:hypothetical protein